MTTNPSPQQLGQPSAETDLLSRGPFGLPTRRLIIGGRTVGLVLLLAMVVACSGPETEPSDQQSLTAGPTPADAPAQTPAPTVQPTAPVSTNTPPATRSNSSSPSPTATEARNGDTQPSATPRAPEGPNPAPQTTEPTPQAQDTAARQEAIAQLQRLIPTRRVLTDATPRDVAEIATLLIQEHPDLTDAHILRAMMLVKLREYDDAITDIEFVLSDGSPPLYDHHYASFPDIGDAHAFHGAILARQGRDDEALAKADIAEEMGSSYAAGVRTIVDYRNQRYNDLKPSSLFNHLSGGLDKQPQLDVDLKLDPDNPWLILARAKLHNHMAEPDLALADLDRAASLDGIDTDALWLRLNANITAGRLDDALTIGRAILEDTSNPVDHTIHYYLGVVNARAGRHPEAKAHFQTAVDLYVQRLAEATPDRAGFLHQPPIYHQAAYAAAYYDAIARDDPPDFNPLCPQRQVQGLDLLLLHGCPDWKTRVMASNTLHGYSENNAWIHMLRAYAHCPSIPTTPHHRYLAACSNEVVVYNYERAIQLDPTIAEAYVGRALSNFSGRRFSAVRRHEAGQYVEAALQADPDNPVLHHNLFLYRSSKKEYDLAIDHLSTLIELVPQEAAQLHFVRGEHHLLNENNVAATDDFLKARELGYSENEVRKALLKASQ